MERNKIKIVAGWAQLEKMMSALTLMPVVSSSLPSSKITSSIDVLENAPNPISLKPGGRVTTFNSSHSQNVYAGEDNF